MSTDFLNEVQASVEEIKKIQQELVDKLKPRFKEIFETFLIENPQVKSVYWTQFTPYFNDGESCEFRVNELYGMLGDEDSWDGEWSYDWRYEGHLPLYDYYFEEYGDTEKGKKWVNKEIDAMLKNTGLSLEELKVLNNRFKELQKAFDSLPEGTMQDIFGDHALITVTKDGIDCEEYDHD